MAEDNEFNTRHLERLLTRQGHRVRLANNGRQALVLAAEAAFDLLLLDVHTPEVDGFEVVRMIRERERTTGGHLPVIALTARSRKEDRERCLAAGMDDFLSKPIRAAELFSAIEAAVSPRNALPSGSNDEDRTNLIDAGVVLAACGGDGEGLRDLCQDYRAYAPDRIAEMTTALCDQNAPALREAAHKLYGLLSAFSSVAGDLASELEDIAARGELDECWPLATRLEKMARELILQVDRLTLQTLRPGAGSTADLPRAADVL